MSTQYRDLWTAVVLVLLCGNILFIALIVYIEATASGKDMPVEEDLDNIQVGGITACKFRFFIKNNVSVQINLEPEPKGNL